MATEETPMTAASFVARSRVHRAARAEIARHAHDVLAPAIADAVNEIVRAAVAPLEAEIVRLRALLDQHRYAGQWQEGRSYKAGCVVSCGGSVHYCNADTATKPGASEDWVLMIPRPRDGKDGKDGKDALPPAAPAPAEPRRPTAATTGRPT